MDTLSDLVHLEKHYFSSTSSHILQGQALITCFTTGHKSAITFSENEVTVDFDPRGIRIRKGRARVVLGRLNDVNVYLLASIGRRVGRRGEWQVGCELVVGFRDVVSDLVSWIKKSAEHGDVGMHL